jgi:ubiquitin-protein ligase
MTTTTPMTTPMTTTTTTPSLLENYSVALENISSTAVKKRITRELLNLEANCSLISIECEFNETNNFDKHKYIINIMDNMNGLVYSIILNNSYPFKQPSIQINFRPYSEFLKIRLPSFSEQLKKIHKINCLCCSTITCGDNWSPAFTINHLIDEIRLLKSYKRDLINKLFADKIKLRHLIADINLDCWLF